MHHGIPSRFRPTCPLGHQAIRASLALTFVLLFGVQPALAVLPGSTFEGDDGNLQNDAQIDWQSLAGNPKLRIGVDTPSGQDDDSLKGKENDPVPGITFVAPVPACRLDTCQAVGGKNSVPPSHSVAVSSVSAGASR